MPIYTRKIVLSGPSQNQAKKLRKRRQSGFGLDRLRFPDGISLPMPENGASSGCQQVLMPVHLRPIGERDYEPLARRPYHDDRLIGLSTSAANVMDDRKWAERKPGEYA